MKNIKKEYAILGRLENDEFYIYDCKNTRRECLDYIYDKIGAGLFLDNKIWIIPADTAQKIIDNYNTLTEEEIYSLPASLIIHL
jgi:hypothetical protein